MGDVVEARMNVAAVRRVDPYAKDIVETSTHVALYSFGENEWIKTEIEGALFVYSRSGRPFHNILVMNRLSTNNLIEPVTDGLELQLQEPFLLYRNSKRRIYGLWFYDANECARVAAKIDRLVKDSCERGDAEPPKPDAAAVDIFSMLTKAQDDYNINKGMKTPDGGRRPRAPDIASQSVMDFFAKAGGGAQLPAAAAQQGAIFGTARPPAVDPAGGSISLQRLMSDPVHSVEHIEKQQRSATPRGDGEHRAKPPGDSKRRSARPDGPKAQGQPPGAQARSGARPIPKPATGSSVPRSNGQSLESESSFASASTPRRSPPPALAGRPRPAADPAEDPRDGGPPSVPPGAQETPQKPALMPPTMFTSSATKASCERPALEGAITPIRPPADRAPADPRPEPLTRNQLLQALNYLIKNDAEFMTKLHEAYVKSFSELVS